MEIRRFEEIKSNIEKAKREMAQAEGALTQIKTRWKEIGNINTIEEAETFLAKSEKDLEETKVYRKNLEEELEKLTDWDKL